MACRSMPPQARRRGLEAGPATVRQQLGVDLGAAAQGFRPEAAGGLGERVATMEGMARVVENLGAQLWKLGAAALDKNKK